MFDYSNGRRRNRHMYLRSFLFYPRSPQALIVFVAPAFQARSRRFLVLLSAMDCAHVEARMTPFAANWMAQQGPARFAVECANRFVITALIAFFRRVPSKFVPIKWVTVRLIYERRCINIRMIFYRLGDCIVSF